MCITARTPSVTRYGIRRLRLVERDHRNVEAELPAALHLLMELRLVLRAARDLEAAGLKEHHRLAGVGLERRRFSRTPLAAMRVIVSSERSWPLSPAARGEVCDASSALSSSATDSPALAEMKGGGGAERPGADHDGIDPFG